MRTAKPSLSPTLLLNYLWAAVFPLAATLVVLPFHPGIDLSHVAPLYVLAVVLTGVRSGRGPAVASAVFGSLLYAHVYVPPHFSLAISEPRYLLTTAVMVAVALMVGHITSRLRRQADIADRQSRQSRVLYEFAQALAGARDAATVGDVASRFLGAAIDARRVAVLLPADFQAPPKPADPSLVRACVERGSVIRVPAGPDRTYLLIPLPATTGVQGVLGFEIDAALVDQEDAVEWCETIASVVSVALERSRFAETVRETELKHASESLRASILGALSHDLRTPLAALVSLSDAAMLDTLSPARQRRLLGAIRDQAMSISGQMDKLLDMARLNSGQVELERAWQSIDEVVGTVWQSVRAQWKDREVSLDVAPDLPPVFIDAVLMERVLWNLLENAIKYSPPEAPVELAVRRREGMLDIGVCDAGAGLPAEEAGALFEPFRRGRTESDIPGVGLGLAIARTIVEAHGGYLVALDRKGGGACFHIRLPLGEAPALDEEDEA